ncbi:MAG: transporter substrate-binding domain-containing protein [Deltaproteobacteria bacterium]|nr:transporter substrate-binding domain-containing protein [Deltaproteobacteria bacterium]
MKLFKFMVLLLVVPFLLGACNGVNSNVNAAKVSVSPVLDRIAARGELIVGTAGTMPPLNMTDREGKIIGIEADMAKYIASSMDVKLTMKPMPFYELLPALEAGKVDMVISGMTITGQRNMKVAFVGPYFLSGKSILTKDSKIAALENGEDLNDPSISLVVLKGSTSQQVVEGLLPKAKMVAVDKYDDALKMVIDGKVGAMVADYPICLVSVFRFPDQIAVPAGDSLLVNWLQNFLTTYKGSGELKRNIDRWLKNDVWIKQLPEIK